MRIMLLYPGATHSTFDVARGYEQALRARADVVLDSFFYHDYLGFYNASFAAWAETHPDEPARRLDDSAYWTVPHIVTRVVEFAPDVVLAIAGGALHRRAFELLHRLHIPVVLLLTESPYIDYTQSIIIRNGRVTAALTNDAVSELALRAKTAIPVRYLPHSYDPDIHTPTGEATPSDVFFHGTLWPERAALLEGLEHLAPHVVISGYRVDGSEWTSGLLDNQQLAAAYRGTRIALNHHRTCGDQGNITAAYSLGPRAFEIAACGAFQLCDATRPELAAVFGDSVPTYSDRDGLIQQIQHFLRADHERQERAAAACAAVQGCTFAARAENILIPFLTEVCNGR